MAGEKLVVADGNDDREGCQSHPSPPDAVSDVGGNRKPPSSMTNPSRHESKKKLLMLGKRPGLLVRQLKRLQARRKKNSTVEFPVELGMAPFF